jgi:hypothetical protein
MQMNADLSKAARLDLLNTQKIFGMGEKKKHVNIGASLSLRLRSAATDRAETFVNVNKFRKSRT